MMNDYSKMYLSKARSNIANMLSFSVNVLGYKLEYIWSLFINSKYLEQVEQKDPFIIDGVSGTELACLITGKKLDDIKDYSLLNKDEYYWLGSYITYYQYYKNISFKKITNLISINDLLLMYNPYHEMDVMQFCDFLDTLLNNDISKLKQKRLELNLTQKELSIASSIPLRTIQQYEQKKKILIKLVLNT